MTQVHSVSDVFLENLLVSRRLSPFLVSTCRTLTCIRCSAWRHAKLDRPVSASICWTSTGDLDVPSWTSESSPVPPSTYTSDSAELKSHSPGVTAGVETRRFHRRVWNINASLARGNDLMNPWINLLSSVTRVENYSVYYNIYCNASGGERVDWMDIRRTELIIVVRAVRSCIVSSWQNDQINRLQV
jgi:hypothetical protein